MNHIRKYLHRIITQNVENIFTFINKIIGFFGKLPTDKLFKENKCSPGVK